MVGFLRTAHVIELGMYAQGISSSVHSDLLNVFLISFELLRDILKVAQRLHIKIPNFVGTCGNHRMSVLIKLRSALTLM